MRAFWTVPRDWSGETCFILGGGPSLAGFDAERLKGRGRVIAINNAGLAAKPDLPGSGGTSAPVLNAYAPWADGHFWADDVFFDDWADDPRFVAAEHAHRLTITQPGSSRGGSRPGDVHRAARLKERAVELGVKVIKRDDRAALSRDPAVLAGKCSGTRTLNLAALFGAAPIVLLGFDMRPSPPGAPPRWHDDNKRKPRPANYRAAYLPAFRRMASELTKDGVEVLNATPGSALDCFAAVDIERFL